jgi:hypothetical protein
MAAAKGIREAVQAELRFDPLVDARGDTVTLGGHVRSWAEHDAVVGATWMALAVPRVRDYLDVTG